MTPFRNARRIRFQDLSTTARDPWCIGYFIDNEIEWAKPKELVSAILLQSPPQTVKRALVDFFRGKYGAITNLNAAWDTRFDSWEFFLTNAVANNTAKVDPDFKAFYATILDSYYSACQAEVQLLTPGKLYLGSRFHKDNPFIIAAAARHCDVISYNLYRTGLAGFGFKDVDVPLLATEFSFGSLDRGMFWPGLGPASDQEDRAALLENYVRTALENPNMVGAHWFAYNSEPVTGRSDGENGQIGLVDVCDTPYPETIAALRRVGGRLYAVRSAFAWRGGHGGRGPGYAEEYVFPEYVFPAD